MSSTITSNEKPELTKKDCLEYLGRIPAFICMDNIHTRKHRVGQAWMNSLTSGDYAKLTGSLYDPFYADDWPAVIRALRFLLEN